MAAVPGLYLLRVSRTLRAVFALALASLLLVGTASAEQTEDRAIPGAVENNAHRQALLHRTWPSGGEPGSMLVTTSSAAQTEQVAADEDGIALNARTVL